MAISNEQIVHLARPIVDKTEIIADFFKDPENEKAYREWYYQKYGRYPDDGGEI